MRSAVDKYIKYFTSRRFASKFPKYALLSRVLDKLQLKSTTQIPFAAVTAKRGRYYLLYNPYWLHSERTEPIHVLWIFIHEAYHIIRDDISKTIRETKNDLDKVASAKSRVMNVAQDIVINEEIKQDFPDFSQHVGVFADTYNVPNDKPSSYYYDEFIKLKEEYYAYISKWARQAKEWVRNDEAERKEYPSRDLRGDVQSEIIKKMRQTQEGISTDYIKESLEQWTAENRDEWIEQNRKQREALDALIDSVDLEALYREAKDKADKNQREGATVQIKEEADSDADEVVVVKDLCAVDVYRDEQAKKRTDTWSVPGQIQAHQVAQDVPDFTEINEPTFRYWLKDLMVYQLGGHTDSPFEDHSSIPRFLLDKMPDGFVENIQPEITEEDVPDDIVKLLDFIEGQNDQIDEAYDDDYELFSDHLDEILDNVEILKKEPNNSPVSNSHKSSNPFIEGEPKKEDMIVPERIAYDMAVDSYKKPNLGRGSGDGGSATSGENKADRLKDHADQLKEEALKEHEKECGNLPSDIVDSIDIDDKRVSAPWFKLLRRYSSNILSKKLKANPTKPREDEWIWHEFDENGNAQRREDPIPIYPYWEEKKKTFIMYSIDVSGSVSKDEFRKGLEELKGLFDMSGNLSIVAVQASVGIKSIDLLRGRKELDKYIEEGLRHGDGGTCYEGPIQLANFINNGRSRPRFEPGNINQDWLRANSFDGSVLRDINKEADSLDLLIYHTDGVCTIPNRARKFDVIWCLTGEDFSSPPTTPDGITPGVVVQQET